MRQSFGPLHRFFKGWKERRDSAANFGEESGGNALSGRYLIVGLGNPGNRYNNTRHNAGFEVLDKLSLKLGIAISKVKFKGLWGEGTFEGKRVALLKPSTFMNLSGESVVEAVNWFKPDLDKLILVYDDVDVPLGRIRIRPKGSAGTHNGMKSVVYLLYSDAFPRVRVGVGKPTDPRFNLADFVLAKLTAEERADFEKGLDLGVDSVLQILQKGLTEAMNLYNGT